MFTASYTPGPEFVFGGKQDLSELPGGLAALVSGYQTARHFRIPFHTIQGMMVGGLFTKFLEPS
jgi:hypothetical protein